MSGRRELIVVCQPGRFAPGSDSRSKTDADLPSRVDATTDRSACGGQLVGYDSRRWSQVGRNRQASQRVRQDCNSGHRGWQDVARWPAQVESRVVRSTKAGCNSSPAAEVSAGSIKQLVTRTRIASGFHGTGRPPPNSFEILPRSILSAHQIWYTDRHFTSSIREHKNHQ
jgi:hypothetical protein